MEIEKVTIYGWREAEQLWKRRKTIPYAIYSPNRSETIEPYNEKFKTKHAVFPSTIDPNSPEEAPLIGFMQRKVESFLSHYKSDFYYHDTVDMYELNKDFIWLCRDMGTNIFRTEFITDIEKESTLVTFEHYKRENSNRYLLYRIKNDDIQKLTFDKALGILESIPINQTV